MNFAVLATEDERPILTEDGREIALYETEPDSDYFQRMILRVVPPWLTRENGRRLLQGIAELYDRISDRNEESLTARFPDPSRPDALSRIGTDRRITRGPLESAESYATRLLGWREAHRTRGGPYALLGQLRAYYVGAEHRIDLVYASGSRYTLWPDGAITRDSIVWREDSDPAQWAQAWIVHHLDADPGALTPEEREQYLSIPRDWNAAHVLPIAVGLAWGGWSTIWDLPPASLTWDELDALTITWDALEARGVF